MKIKIYINGLKDGHENIYPGQKPREFDVLKDERSMSGGSAKGESLYSISMSNGGCVFSKYYGIYSIPRRDYGYIAFSVFIDNKHKLPGKELKNLLDELSGCYLEQYVIDWKLDNCKEGWGFVDEIVERFEKHVKPLSDVLLVEPSQNLTNAYVYCQNDDELVLYFENPYQGEYEQYRQIFLLEKQNENLLNILKHDLQANLTGKIDLENPQYKLVLSRSDSGLEIEVKVNGKKQFNDSKVYRKDKLTIVYSKKYCNPICVEGSATEERLRPYLGIDELNKRITVKQDVKLEPASKKITIIAKDDKGRSVEDVEIVVSQQGYNSKRKEPEFDGSYVFIGDELGKSYTVTASKNGLSGSKNFIPDQMKGAELFLEIQKSKLVKFIVQDNYGILYECNVKVEEKKSHLPKKSTSKDEPTYEFSGDEIEKKYVITVSKNKYKTSSFEFCPKDENGGLKYIELKRQEEIKGTHERERISSKEKYCLVIDSNKGYRENCPDYIENINELKYFEPKAKKGYRFVKWEDYINEPFDGCEGHFKAVFEETWWHKHKGKVLLAAIVVILVALIMIVISLVRGKESKPPKNEETFAHVQDSIKLCGNNVSSLNALLDRWKLQEPDIVKTGGFLGFGGTPDSTNYKAWEKGLFEIEAAIKQKNDQAVSEKIKAYLEGDELFLDKLKEYEQKVTDDNLKKRINDCIQLRTLLNKGDLKTVKDFLYSEKQASLKTVIDNIPKKYIEVVSNKMKNDTISKMSLKKIVEFISFAVNEAKEEEAKSAQSKTTGQGVTIQPGSSTAKSQTGGTGSKRASGQVENSKVNEAKAKFWSLVKEDKPSADQFNQLFKTHEKDWWDNNLPGYWNFYHTYLVCVKCNGCKEDGQFCITKGLHKVPILDRKNCETLAKLQALIRAELDKK